MVYRLPLIFSMDSGRNTTGHEAFYKALDEMLRLKGDRLMAIFIKEGPDELRSKIGATMDKHWEYIFDYLVFSEDVLKRCAVNFLPFFKGLIIEQGPSSLRRVFKIEAEKYDTVFEKLLDLVAVSTGAVYDYVYANRQKYIGLILNGQMRDLRKELGLSSSKYDPLWLEILEMLQEGVCTKVYAMDAFDKGLATFSMMMNGLRKQRSLRSFKNMWAYSAVKGE